MKAKRNKAKHPAGFRYANKDAWLSTVTDMLNTGETYGGIAKTLGVGHSTVCRFVWANGLASIETHRNTTRAAILKGQVEPEVMHYQAIEVKRKGVQS